MKIPCSVPVLTLNSRWSLETLLPILMDAFADVFIIDGNSTDGTQALAHALGVRVEKQFEHDVPNQRIAHFARMRQRSWELAAYDWIYWIDADELPTPEQIEKVRKIVAANDAMTVHRFLRLAQLPDGRIVRHAFFYPERTPRLFNKASGAALVDRPVHEKFNIPPGVRLVDHPEAYVARWTAPRDMWKRQRGYIDKDAENVSPTVWGLVRWVYMYNLRSFVGQTYRALRATIVGHLHGETALPWSYNFFFLLYRVILTVESTRVWMKRRFQSGRVFSSHP